MFNIGGGELIVILLIALIVLGPSRLPDAARQIGKAMAELRRLSSSFQNEVKSALDTADDPNQVASRRNVLQREDASAPDTPDTPEARPRRTKPLVAAPADDAAAPGEPASTKAAPNETKPKNGTAVEKKPTGPKAEPRGTKSP